VRQKVVAELGGVAHIRGRMFRLTRQEMYAVALLVGAVLVGSAVRQWRSRQPAQPVAKVADTKGH